MDQDLDLAWQGIKKALQDGINEMSESHFDRFGKIVIDEREYSKIVISKSGTLPADYIYFKLRRDEKQIFYEWRRVFQTFGNEHVQKRGVINLSGVELSHAITESKEILDNLLRA